MESLEFKRRQFSFKIDGKEYRVNHPTVGQLRSFESDNKKSTDNFESTIVFLEKLGLDRELSLGLEMDHLLTIVNSISGQKKS